MADRSGQPIFSRWKSPSDWPAPLTYCVGEARRILSYFEHLTSEQRPPRRLWHSQAKCSQWIEDHMPGRDGASGGAPLTFKDSEIER